MSRVGFHAHAGMNLRVFMTYNTAVHCSSRKSQVESVISWLEEIPFVKPTTVVLRIFPCQSMLIPKEGQA